MIGNLSAPKNRESERRKFERRPISEQIWLVDKKKCHLYSCYLKDISDGGVSIEISNDVKLSEELMIKLERQLYASDCKIVWRSEEAAGIRLV